MSGVRKALFLTIILTLIPPADAVRINPELWEGSAVVEGGYSILVEEYTATWCENCAQIDEDLEIITDDHGSRISMISYHPSDCNICQISLCRNLQFSETTLTRFFFQNIRLNIRP